MKVLESKFLQDFVRMATDGFEMGWHERNAGNLTYRLTKEEASSIKEDFDAGAWQPIGVSVPKLAGELFLVTGSGKFFRNVSIATEDSLGIIEIDHLGENFRIIWGLIDKGKPTSELPTHLLSHAAKLEMGYRIVYHAHTPAIIALTFILPPDDIVFTRKLWEMMTECPVVFPDGVGIVPWMIPGGIEIGIQTSKLMSKYDAAIWCHHGTFATGPSFDITFGLMHTLEKAADILIKIMSTNQKILQTITPQNFRDLAEAFGVTLDEKFLQD